MSLTPGKEIELYELNLELGEGNDRGGVPKDSTLFGMGKFTVQYERILGNTSLSSVSIKFDPILSKLATGKLELEVKEAKKLPDKKEKEGFTAWGKEDGGLQAGLCFSNANDIRIGGKAKAVVKLRNVSSEAIFVSAWPLWLVGPPRIVDTQGKPVRTTTPPARVGIKIDPDPLILKPGQTVDLDKIDVIVNEVHQLVRAPEGLVDFFAIHVQPGKYKADCIGFLKELPSLATGKLELEVKEAEKPPQSGLPKPIIEKKKVYTPDEVLLEQEKARGKAIDGSNSNIVTVEFSVQAVTKPTEIKLTSEKGSPFVVGHGPDDMCLHPQPLRKFEEKQFTAILTSKALKQLQGIGVQDVGKHFIGKTIRVSGQIKQHTYSGDDPPIEPHYDLVIENVSQLEVVD